jgi:hypothetical protein
MSTASLRTDSCSYQEQLRRSVGPGMYMLEKPANDYESCARDIPADPYMRWQAWGPGFCEPGSVVDVGSELLGLNYKSTRCNGKQYNPYASSKEVASMNQCKANGKTEPRACMAPTENTRLSNPPCTLRGTGWNRWEWLCYDPQETAIMPFDAYINYRIVAKDNHKPNEVPNAKASTSVTATWTPPPNVGASAPGNPYEKQVVSCNQMKQMGA